MLFDGGAIVTWINSFRSAWALWGLDKFLLAVLIIGLAGIALFIFARISDRDMD